MENIKIIPVKLSDLAQLQKIGRLTFFETFAAGNTEENMKNYLEEGFSEVKLSSELADPDSQFYFAILGDDIIGYLKVNIGSSQTELKDISALEIERIYIKPNSKRLGLGKYLLNYAIEKAKELQKTSAWLGVWEENINALNFYKKKNFVCFSEHVFELGGEKQRDILMKLIIK